MTDLLDAPTPSPDLVGDSIQPPRLPKLAALISVIIALLVSRLVFLVFADQGSTSGSGFGHVVREIIRIVAGPSPVGFVILVGLIHAVLLPVWAGAVEGRRGASDRLATTLIWYAVIIALVPLVWLVAIVIHRGAPAIDGFFLSHDMRNVVGTQPGGIYHALIGTLLVTLVAAIISVPIGLMSAVYLVEYGKGKRIARVITFLVDVMTGIPSIVAGLFALALFQLIFGPAITFGFGGSVAISLLMIPIVVRSSEEMLRLVPVDLREASYALGVAKWRTIVKVVIPTALGGIVTGVTLAVARVIGETAPLLVIAGFTASTNYNPFSGRMTTLPVYIYYSYTQPGIVPFGSPPGTDPPGIARAWGAALVLIVIVMVLNLVARIIGKIFAPKKG